MRPADAQCWIFDLDNTLYPASCRLFDQVERRIGEYVQQLLNLEPEAARALQKQYFRDHQTTLNGLMIHHKIKPEEFLDFVHQIDLAPVVADQRLDQALARLPGRKLIYTNGSVRHAENVMGAWASRGISRASSTSPKPPIVPKPDIAAYRALVARHGIDPTRAIMLDDMPRNLAPAAELGMTTVWVKTDVELGAAGGADPLHPSHRRKSGGLASRSDEGRTMGMNTKDLQHDHRRGVGAARGDQPQGPKAMCCDAVHAALDGAGSRRVCASPRSVTASGKPTSG